ncbi:hypothetical protein AZI86_07870 [Bdellovibrio bacteriovorus]|uniref:Uncharacterized protein n=1 Tax=Bdellovibrio bacteriovorus TaxID=959 RepID=A0A150WR14_BDEBC|nr:hypothetical protein [Bdellovibrio bacteriovorus]KYG66933.1 hypothetical protein AZI86_07870 [Bdellovibrio bacteriovorus]
MLSTQSIWAAEDPPKEVETSYLEQTRAVVSQNVIRLSDSIDSLFGNTQYEDRYNSSTLHVSQTVYMKDGVPGADSLEASLNLDLPNLKKLEGRIRDYFLSSEEKRAATGSIAPGEEELSLWDFNQESGVIVALPVDYFLRLRARREILTDRFGHSFYQQVGWSKSKEWESKTSLTSDSALNRYLLFRFINDFNWAMTNNELGFSQGPSLIYQMSDTRGISFDFRYKTAIEANSFLTDRLILGSVYRQETPLQWVYMSVNPEIAWERGSHFRPLYNLYLTFEFIFGKRDEKG